MALQVRAPTRTCFIMAARRSLTKVRHALCRIGFNGKRRSRNAFLGACINGIEQGKHASVQMGEVLFMGSTLSTSIHARKGYGRPATPPVPAVLPVRVVTVVGAACIHRPWHTCIILAASSRTSSCCSAVIALASHTLVVPCLAFATCISQMVQMSGMRGELETPVQHTARLMRTHGPYL